MKIFDFLELEEKIKNKIEFIDLPGPDRKNNTFSKKEYFRKILKFSNCCIYDNEPKTIDDKESIERMIVQYTTDKEKVFPTLQYQFIKTCLFLIYKSDTLNNDEDRITISNNLFKNISKVEKNIKKKTDINISFFSGKNFIYFLEIYYYYYVEVLEKDPSLLINKLFNQFIKKIFIFKSVKSYIDKEFSIIEEKFELNLDYDSENKDELQIPEQFKKIYSMH